MTITLSGGGGTLTDGTSLLTPVSAGVYTLTGTAAAITTELEALVFTPTAGAPGTSATTTFTLSDVSSVATINGTVLLTATTPFLQSNVAIVTDTDPALVAPVILTPAGGGPVERLTTSDAPVEQLFDFLLEDNNAGATDTLTITLSGGGGTLTDGTSLLTPVSAGVYTLTGTAAAITTELEALVFTPTAGAPGTSATTTFTLSDASSVATINGTVLLRRRVLQSNVAIVTAPSGAGCPRILTLAGGGPVERLTTSDAPSTSFLTLFRGQNAGATDKLTITLSGGGGTLTDGTSLLTPVSAASSRSPARRRPSRQNSRHWSSPDRRRARHVGDDDVHAQRREQRRNDQRHGAAVCHDAVPPKQRRHRHRHRSGAGCPRHLDPGWRRACRAAHDFGCAGRAAF